ncbi:MAG: tRNA (adenosine(37)-N6)-dimethylallyltransferase MiaA [Clostridia bacterium]|nr:tRNA (adenosine(37)-N6)-dimethylallyltransferase MiaA [Clostridia bacterium]
MKMNGKIKILAVTGATASGKSALALELCRRLDGELVSCDSMQIYRGMDVGTAKPTNAEKREIPHHMIDVCDPSDNYSASDYADAAKKVISDVYSRGKLPILCGGTGLYLDALLRPTSFSEAGSGDGGKIREELKKFVEENGNAALHEMLRKIDPESAEAIHPNNVKRVMRAIEIYRTTGMTKSESDKASVVGDSPYDCTVITLDYGNRDVLYRRIEKRVDAMMEAGLEREVRELFASGALPGSSTAAQAIGYKEMLSYLRGDGTLIDAVETIKKNTRNYAKRQITWFRRYDGIRLTADEGGRIKTATELADEVMKQI